MTKFKEFLAIRAQYNRLKTCMINDAGNVRAIPLLNTSHQQLVERVKSFKGSVSEANLSDEEMADYIGIVDDLIALPSLREEMLAEAEK